jgi:hypothetical protein
VASRLGPARRGCVALVAVPLLTVAAPVVALLRRSGVRRRGDKLLVAVRRVSFGDLVRLRCELDIPLRRLAAVARAVSGAVAEGASRIGRTVGCVGIVHGEEPILVALAPTRDVVAARVLAALGSGEAHRRPELWLTLPAGVYLGEVVDPYAPFEAEEGTVLRMLRERGVGHALRVEVLAAPAGTRIVLTLYAPRAELRKLFTVARSALADLPGWAAMR